MLCINCFRTFGQPLMSSQFNIYPLTGDQVSKKGGMTGGFYDYRRSKLKFMNMVVQNKRAINMKEKELEEVRNMLQDILLAISFIFSCIGSTFVFWVRIIIVGIVVK
jgi:hypothetical protein